MISHSQAGNFAGHGNQRVAFAPVVKTSGINHKVNRFAARRVVDIRLLKTERQLVTLLADNRSRVNELLDTFPLLARTIEHSNRQHEAIVFAILAGNEQGAVEAMHEHLEASAVLLRGFLA